MERIKGDLQTLIGKCVVSSNTGGGASSVLLLKFDNDNAIWAWRYWEISCGEELVSCSEDDDTPVIGKMAVAANMLKGKRVLDVKLVEENLNLGILFNENYELWLYTEKENCKELLSLNNWEYEMPSLNLCYIVTSQVRIEMSEYSE